MGCGISKSAAVMDNRIAEFFGRLRLLVADVFLEEVGKPGKFGGRSEKRDREGGGGVRESLVVVVVNVAGVH